jgi:DNA-binding NarL/FixJ family response regulator
MEERARGTVLSVFIADDSPPVAEMLTQLLSSPGRVEVIGVGGTEAGVIASVRECRPDVIVLDLQLADGSGTNVIRAVRAERGLANTRILVTSNHDSPQLRAGCLGLGADGYFDKVKELKQLAATLDRLADGMPRRGS